jgi:hypothetical protein
MKHVACEMLSLAGARYAVLQRSSARSRRQVPAEDGQRGKMVSLTAPTKLQSSRPRILE